MSLSESLEGAALAWLPWSLRAASEGLREEEAAAAAREGGGSLLLQLLPPGSVRALHTSMALLVHLKTVSELRGKGDRIAKVTFRGRERPHLRRTPALG